MEEGNKPSMLDSHTPESIIQMFKDTNDATDELIELIKSTSHGSIRKLRQIFLGISNYNINSIYDLSQSPNRMYRYTATYLVFSLIRLLCKKKASFEQIEDMYNNVFPVRFRDVDPLIRGMCVQFLSEWTVENPTLRKFTYLRYLIWAINDRNDSVRRRTIKAILKLSISLNRKQESYKNINNENASNSRKKIQINTITDEIKLFYVTLKDNLIPMALFDANINLQKISHDLIFYIYNKFGFFKEHQILRVLASDCSSALHRKEALNILCPDGVWNLDRIHELVIRSEPKIFRGFCADNSETESFILNITEFLKSTSVCCESKYLCFFDVLKQQDLSIEPSHFLELIEITRDNVENTMKVLECLSQIKLYKEHPNTTRTILEIFKNRCLSNPVLVEGFVPLLKNVEMDFSINVMEIVEIFKERIIQEKKHAVQCSFNNVAILPLIKHFDISDILTESSKSVEKCYGSLWQIYNGKYDRIKDVVFVDSEEYLILTEFLILFYIHGNISEEEVSEWYGTLGPVFTTNLPTEKLTESWSENQIPEKLPEDPLIEKLTKNQPTDNVSAFKILFRKLFIVVAKNPFFDDEIACYQLYKLINLNMFTEYADLLFEKCSDEAITWFIENCERIKPLLSGFLKAASTNKKLHRFAKKVATRCSKTETEKYIFHLIKDYVSNINMLDAVLIHFIPMLGINECIVLEGLSHKSKFKTACLRKSKSKTANKSVENLTVI